MRSRLLVGVLIGATAIPGPAPHRRRPKAEPRPAEQQAVLSYYSGSRRFPLTVWGTGSVCGKAVLIPATEEDELAQIDAAARAGAAALLVRAADRSAWTVFAPDAIGCEYAQPLDVEAPVSTG